MEKIDWSKVEIKEAGTIGIGNPYNTPKLDINSNCIVGMGDSPYTKFYLSGVVSKEQKGKTPHGNNCGCELLKEGDKLHIGLGCPNPNNIYKIEK
jgi:hypothetical protein